MFDEIKNLQNSDDRFNAIQELGSESERIQAYQEVHGHSLEEAEYIESEGVKHAERFTPKSKSNFFTSLANLFNG